MNSLLQKIERSVSRWWLTLAAGIAAVILAVLLYMDHSAGFESARVILITAMIVIGALTLPAAFLWPEERAERGWTIVTGGCMIAFGVLAAVRPEQSARLLLILFSLTLILRSAAGFLEALTLNTSVKPLKYLTLLFSAMSMGTGILCLVRPDIAQLTIGNRLATALLLLGISLILLGLLRRKRKITREKVEDFRKTYGEKR